MGKATVKSCAQPAPDQLAGLSQADLDQLASIIEQIREVMFCVGNMIEQPARWDSWLRAIRAAGSTLRYCAKVQPGREPRVSQTHTALLSLDSIIDQFRAQ